MIKKLTIILLIILFGAFLSDYIWKNIYMGVSFESSDRLFESSECLFKGRDFETVLFFFEKFRFLSRNEDAILYRTTKEPIFHKIYSRKNNLKWKVPYRAPSQLPGRDLIDPELKNILNRGLIQKERRIIETRMEKYLKRLKEK
jgi:hypothetical protein